MNTGSIVGISAGVLVALLGGSVLGPKIFAAAGNAAGNAASNAASNAAQQAHSRMKDEIRKQNKRIDALYLTTPTLTDEEAEDLMTQQQKDHLNAAEQAVQTTIKIQNQNPDNFITLYDQAVEKIQQVNKLQAGLTNFQLRKHFNTKVKELVKQLKTKLQELLNQGVYTNEEVKQLKQGLITIMKNRKKVRV